MRRQRALRTASASSLCIFCACRLGAIELPATAAPLHPVRSSSQRRSISHTRPPFQSSATASASSAIADDSDAVPPWYDPTSSLSITEQREKANRMAIRQQYETKRQEEGTRAQQDVEAGRKAADKARRFGLPGSRKITLTGSTLGEAMVQSSQSTKAKSNGDSAFRRVMGRAAEHNANGGSSVVRKDIWKGSSNHSRPSWAKGGQDQSATDEKGNGSRMRTKAPVKKVSNPFGPSASSTKATAMEPEPGSSSGWGIGSTQTAPLEYSETATAVVHRSVLKPGAEYEPNGTNPNIQDNYGFKKTSLGTKTFRPTSRDVDQQDVGDVETVENVEHAETRSEHEVAKLQSQQLVDDRSTGESSAGPARNLSSATNGPGAIDAEKNILSQASPVEMDATEASQSEDVVEKTENAGTSEVQPSTAEEVIELESSESIPTKHAAPEVHSNVGHALPNDSQQSASPPVVDSVPATSSVGSFWYIEPEVESPAEPSTSDVLPTPESIQEPVRMETKDAQPEAVTAETAPAQESTLKQVSPESHVAQTERETYAHIPTNRAAPEKREDHSTPNAQQPATSAAALAPSPLPQMARQTQQGVKEGAPFGDTAVSQQASNAVHASSHPAPPPPPGAVPPPAYMIPAGGQLVWQPIHGHPYGGQWAFQITPPSLTAFPPPTPVTEAPSHTQYTQPERPGHVSAASAPSTSLSDSGYRAMPFSADEFQAPSNIDEEKAANWQHLRRKDAQATKPAVQSSPPAVSSPPQVQQQQTQQPRPQQNFDDENWVDENFQNHVREREERLRLQIEREEKHKAQQQREQSVQSHENEDNRRLYNGPAQTYKDKECARCGERGHVARFCTKQVNPFSSRSDRPNPIREDHGMDARSRRPNEVRVDEHDRTRNPFAARDPPTEARRNPFASRESSDRELADYQRPRQAWGADQVISTEPVDLPKREPRFRTVVTDAPAAAAQDPNATSRFEPFGGRQTEHDREPRPAATDHTVDTRSARRSDRMQADPEIDEHTPAPESRASREKAARKSRWAEREGDVFADKGKDFGRKAQRGGRREFDEDEDDEAEARDNFRARKAARQAEKEAKEEKRRKEARREREVKKAEDATPISIPEFVSVQQLSQLLGVRYEQFIDRLQELGYDDVFPGMTLNSETSGMIAMEYNFDPTIDTGVREEEERDLKARPEVEDKEFLPMRPPVVTIMGHVDHGKTTILDYLRKSSVAAGEAGGITQHIGAFSVPMASSGKTITFLDTPGHAAFLAMRQRGANVTDIVILVVAADDSVKPQTLEALKHAKAAGVPMIVAINKVDKPEADIQRVKQDLARHGVEIEDFGGETQVVPVSGKTGQGMDDLEETVVALSEILDQRAETDGPVEGWILEATTKANGRVATVLVRRGTLRPGAVIVAGKTWARVRSLHNEGGRPLQEVGPGMPVEVDGWRDQPIAGDEVLQAPNEQKATSVVEYRQEREEREKAAADMEAINEARRKATERQQKEREAAQALKQAQRTAHAQGGTADVASKPADIDAPQQEQTGQIDVPFIIKADVSGSAEAVSAYIMSVSNPLIAPSVLHSQVGPVHESDIELANAAGGHIIAFNLPPDAQMQARAEAQGVKILENNIIYRVLDDVKAVLEEKLPPILTQRVLGEAEISAEFDISAGGRKKVRIAGCKVRNGVVGKGSRVRVLRGSEKVYDGTITSLKNVKKDVTEMRKGSDCGMAFEDWQDFEVGDQVQSYEEMSEKRKF
ncbi:hypothetical protein BST61_g2643 [Cercospora zeina]